MKTLLLLAVLLFPAVSFADTTVEVPNLYAYETSEGMKVGAVFGALPIVAGDDELIAVSSTACSHVEMHMMQETEGIMQMRQVTSIPLTKNKANVLSPKGYHLMLMDLKEPLKKGHGLFLKLTFKNAGERMVNIPIFSRKVKFYD